MSREPEEYKKGSAYFLGCHIDLSYRPLIPRVETEFWVGEIIKDMQKKGGKRSLKVLDIFAGSGCIGVAILKHVPGALVDFAEKNIDYIRQIEKNVPPAVGGSDPPTAGVPMAGVVWSDVFQNISRQYDYIFANPPYIARERKDTIQESVLQWEDEGAYFADDDGLFYIKKLLDEGGKYLMSQGKMYIEFDSWQKPRIEQYARQAGWKKVLFIRDQYRHWRVVMVQRG